MTLAIVNPKNYEYYERWHSDFDRIHRLLMPYHVQKKRFRLNFAEYLM